MFGSLLTFLNYLPVVLHIYTKTTCYGGATRTKFFLAKNNFTIALPNHGSWVRSDIKYEVTSSCTGLIDDKDGKFFAVKSYLFF